MQAVDERLSALERMWESHRDSVRRLLLGLGRDIDLADDLLQETYLRARAGISSYRGGDPRAWLSAIAKNAFRNHVRQRYVRAEIPLDSRPGAIGADSACDRLDLLAIRQAVAALPAALRTALIMKHYVGFTYPEIASHTRCAVGTAKWRVSEALDLLRAALRAERRTAMAGCTELNGISMVDYVYGVLPAEAAAKAKAHLAKCRSCREQARELKRVTSMLDALEGDHKQMHFIELDTEGVCTLYETSSHVNTSDQILGTLVFQSGKGYRVQHLYQDGEEVTFTVGPCPESDALETYTVTLAHPVPPGERYNELSVYPPEPASAAQRLGDGRFRFHWKQRPGSNETAYVQVIRLPAGAHLLSAEPQPAATRSNGTTTLIWRTVLGPHQFFECTVEYRPEKAEAVG